MAARGHLDVRVIAGTLKGRVLRYPAGLTLRPTMQRTKASVFESLGDAVRDAIFVDLYAGAGGVGIEALSRGARSAHFVEDDRAALVSLRENLERCGVEPRRGVVHGERVMDFLAGPFLERIAPDIVYADPPYDADEIRLLLEFFNGIDYPLETLLVVEHRQGAVSLERFERLSVLRIKKFGESCVSYIVVRGKGS
jgi:16S rRNA (guanine966-N2)-methyltransferase